MHEAPSMRPFGSIHSGGKPNDVCVNFAELITRSVETDHDVARRRESVRHELSPARRVSTSPSPMEFAITIGALSLQGYRSGRLRQARIRMFATNEFSGKQWLRLRCSEDEVIPGIESFAES